MLPPLVLILLVLGSIFAGVATPTEAGALGARRRHGPGRGQPAADAASPCAGRCDETTRLTAMVVFLLIGSTAFALVFRGLYGDVWIEELLTNLPGGKIGLLVVANLAIFVLGLLHRLLRDRLHHPAAARARGARSLGDRPGLVRRDDRR